MIKKPRGLSEIIAVSYPRFLFYYLPDAAAACDMDQNVLQIPLWRDASSRRHKAEILRSFEGKRRLYDPYDIRLFFLHPPGPPWPFPSDYDLTGFCCYWSLLIDEKKYTCKLFFFINCFAPKKKYFEAF